MRSAVRSTVRSAVFAALVPATLLLVAVPARGSTLECHRVEDNAISVDGLRNDWSSITIESLRGKAVLTGKDQWQGKPDLEGKVRCGHNSKGTFLLVEVNDDQVVRTRRPGTREDRVEFIFATAKGKTRTLRIHPPNARHRKASVRWVKGRRSTKGITHRVIRLRHGYAIEMKIVDGGVPGYALGSPKLRMSIRIIDHDGGPSRKADTVMGTGGTTVATLGVVEYDSAKELLAGFLKQKGLRKSQILHYKVGNFVTGRAREQLVIAGTFVALMGENLGSGGATFSVKAPWAKKQSDLLRFRAVDLDGNGNLDIAYVVRQTSAGGLTRDILVVLRFLDSNRFDIYFMHEIAKRQGRRVLTNKYRFIKRGKKTDIQISLGKATGFTQQTYRTSHGGNLQGLLTPWGKKKKTFQFAYDGVTEK
jgi:Carbohydrate family 9 binding domain-like